MLDRRPDLLYENCLSEENIADPLTKSSKSAHLLMSIVRTGSFNLPGGTSVRERTMNAVRTWSQFMQAEAQVKTANKSEDKNAENQKVPAISSKTLVVKHLEKENCMIFNNLTYYKFMFHAKF